MVRKLTTVSAIVIAFAVSACGRDPQPAVDPQPAPPVAAVDSDPVTGGETEAPAVDEAPVPPQEGGAQPAPPAGAPARPAAPTDGSGPAPAPTQAQPEQPVQTPQDARDGAALLRRAAAAYENVRSLQADFVMNFENPLLRQRLTSRGTLYQRQPDRIALRFSEPAGDLIVGDGQDFWVYYPSNDPRQVIRAPAAAAGESAVNLQAQFIGNPVERFQHTLDGTESVGGRTAHALTLVPRQRAEYRSLKVWIDERDALVRRFEITEHNGTVRRFDLSGLQVNPSIPDAVFRFTPPAGAQVVGPR